MATDPSLIIRYTLCGETLAPIDATSLKNLSLPLLQVYQPHAVLTLKTSTAAVLKVGPRFQVGFRASSRADTIHWPVMDSNYLTTQVSTIIGQLHGLFDEIGVPSHERESREAEVRDEVSRVADKF